jgi:hypothetical protein
MSEQQKTMSGLSQVYPYEHMKTLYDDKIRPIVVEHLKRRTPAFEEKAASWERPAEWVRNAATRFDADDVKKLTAVKSSLLDAPDSDDDDVFASTQIWIALIEYVEAIVQMRVQTRKSDRQKWIRVVEKMLSPQV